MLVPQVDRESGNANRLFQVVSLLSAPFWGVLALCTYPGSRLMRFTVAYDDVLNLGGISFFQYGQVTFSY